MTSPAIPAPAHANDWKTRSYRRLLVVVLSAAGIAGAVVKSARASSRPAVVQIRDHAFTIVGLGLFDSAMFVHSLFTGLLVTGLTFLLFEWKVAAE